MRQVWLLRHGQTEWSVNGKHTGHTDIPLTTQGEEEAARAAKFFTGKTFGLILVSPALRAQRTAQLAGLTDTVEEPRLWEWDYGGYEGRTTPEIRQERPGWDVWRDGVIPGATPGETVEQVGARADAVLASLKEVLDSGEDVLLISHGHMSRIVIARWLGLPAETGGVFVVETATLSILGFERERPVLRALNVRA